MTYPYNTSAHTSTTLGERQEPMTITDSKPQSPAEMASYLREAVIAFVRDSDDNRLKEIDNTPYYEEPLVSFADGDDPLFSEYKTIIGEFHLTPREVLRWHLRQKLGQEDPRINSLSVISYVLPIARETRASNRRMTVGPSRRWNHVRFPGQEFNEAVARHVVSLVEDLGGHAVVPDHTPLFKVVKTPQGDRSTWSHRHAAYAAGLGTFSLSDGFITPRGLAMRCGSIVTDLPLPAQPRPYAHHLANCAFYVDRSCDKCIARCPAGAITEQGHDKIACKTYMNSLVGDWVQQHGQGYYVKGYVGCGLCQTKVPCEASIPKAARLPSTKSKQVSGGVPCGE